MKMTMKKNDKTSVVSTLMQNYSKKIEPSRSTPTKQIVTNNTSIKELTNSFLKKDEGKETNVKVNHLSQHTNIISQSSQREKEIERC